jgi:hypothetical protein
MICGAAAAFAAIRWLILPGRIPMYVRIGIFAVVFAVLPFKLSPLLAERGMAHWLDRIDAVAQEGGPPGTLDRLVDRFAQRYGASACSPVVDRFADPAAALATRLAMRRILVEWKGDDLGDDNEAWRAWCTAVVHQPRAGE